MSQLNISTLANLAGSETTPIADVVNGSARAWVNFKGSGVVTIRASYNVSSITDRGIGRFTVNLTTSMADSNYATLGTAQDDDEGSTRTAQARQSSVSAYLISIENVSGAFVDTENISSCVLR